MSNNGRPISNISSQENSGTTFASSENTNQTDEQTESKPKYSILNLNHNKHEDLKQMLDSNKNNLKLDAMQRIIGMIAKGKDVADLFAAVVKNVASKNMEIKKLVYVYLMRYAEEQQDLALLSIATFQRGLKDPNQLIRASALRVLSSIRIPSIITIMMLAIQDAVNDMSSYVRKTAANAITKLYDLDPELKDELIVIIAKLLSDKIILVNGSAIQAFEHVCPERIDLIHKNYRRLCNLLVDIDEWGQLTVLNMLIRYARLQFIDPNKTVGDEKTSFYDKEESSLNKEKQIDNVLDKDEKDSTLTNSQPYFMDHDHRLLLRCTKPLLQSRNSAVIMSVAQLYYYVAPRSEISIIAKSLIRLLRCHREIQTVVLKCIVPIADKHKEIFEPHIKSFYVHSNDSSYVKQYKLEILTILANPSNIATVLREFQTYVLSLDKEFAAQTIHAIGRCASRIPDVTEACLNGLVSLMSKKSETLVAESVVVIKKLLQINPSKYGDAIKHIARVVDTVTVPTARASILWIIGEYSDRISKFAPDVLRKVAKTFIDEENIVKYQILNLAAKLYIVNYKQTNLIVQYIFSLAKYDANYDIRDKARLLRGLLFQADRCPELSKNAKKILLATKPAPILESPIRIHDQYTIGSLSYVIGQAATGYRSLPDFATEPSNSSIRDVEIIRDVSQSSSSTPKAVPDKNKKTKSDKHFLSNEETSSEESDDDDDDDDDDDGDDDEEEEEVEDENENKEEVPETSANRSNNYEQLDIQSKNVVDSKSESSEEESEQESQSEETTDDDDTDDEHSIKTSMNVPKSPSNIAINNYSMGSEERTLSQSDFESMFGPSSPTPNVQEKPKMNILEDFYNLSTLLTTSPALNYIRQYDCLNRITGQGLQVQYRFPRTPFRLETSFVHIELVFTNTTTNRDIQSIKFLKSKSDVNIKGFNDIDVLPSGTSITTSIGVDFKDKTQPAIFEISFDGKHLSTPLTIPIHTGELFQPKFLNENDFIQNLDRLRGMNEITDSMIVSEIQIEKLNFTTVQAKLLQSANVSSVPSNSGGSTTYRFSGQTISNKSLLLITINVNIPESKLNFTLNSDQIVLATMLLKDIKEKF